MVAINTSNKPSSPRYSSDIKDKIFVLFLLTLLGAFIFYVSSLFKGPAQPIIDPVTSATPTYTFTDEQIGISFKVPVGYEVVKNPNFNLSLAILKEAQAAASRGDTGAGVRYEAIRPHADDEFNSGYIVSMELFLSDDKFDTETEEARTAISLCGIEGEEWQKNFRSGKLLEDVSTRTALAYDMNSYARIKIDTVSVKENESRTARQVEHDPIFNLLTQSLECPQVLRG